MSTLWGIVCSSSSSGCLSAGFASDAHFSCVTDWSRFSLLRGRLSSVQNSRKNSPNERIIVRNWISGNIQFSVWSVHGHARFFGTRKKRDKLNVTEHDFWKEKNFIARNAEIMNSKKNGCFLKKQPAVESFPGLVQIKQRPKTRKPLSKHIFISEEEKLKAKILNFR